MTCDYSVVKSVLITDFEAKTLLITDFGPKILFTTNFGGSPLRTSLMLAFYLQMMISNQVFVNVYNHTASQAKGTICLTQGTALDILLNKIVPLAHEGAKVPYLYT